MITLQCQREKQGKRRECSKKEKKICRPIFGGSAIFTISAYNSTWFIKSTWFLSYDCLSKESI